MNIVRQTAGKGNRISCVLHVPLCSLLASHGQNLLFPPNMQFVDFLFFDSMAMMINSKWVLNAVTEKRCSKNPTLQVVHIAPAENGIVRAYVGELSDQENFISFYITPHAAQIFLKMEPGRKLERLKGSLITLVDWKMYTKELSFLTCSDREVQTLKINQFHFLCGEGEGVMGNPMNIRFTLKYSIHP